MDNASETAVASATASALALLQRNTTMAFASATYFNDSRSLLHGGFARCSLCLDDCRVLKCQASSLNIGMAKSHSQL